MAFDISSLAAKESTKLHLRHPVTEELLYADDEKKQPIIINLFGKASKQYRAAINAMQNRSLKRQGKKPTAETMREEGIELLVACSDSTENFVFEGQTFPDTASAFRSLYSNDKYDWIKQAVDTELGNLESFLEQ